MSDRVVTYSPAYTLVPTYECFNRCGYCNFRVEPGHDTWLSLEAAAEQLRRVRSHGVIEILILSGEVHPHSARRPRWFQHIEALCRLALDLGFLPHTNAGPLSLAEMAQLKQVNSSMGLMVEQVTPALLSTVHRYAPSKVPALRLQQLEWAGELRIPFTTGLLLGLGETEHDRIETLQAIAQIHQRYGHIQEVILQPHRPGQQQATPMEPFSPQQLLATIEVARQILPDDITLQIPPNLVPPSAWGAAIEAGARDLGGIGPKDEVNPDYPHPYDAQLAHSLHQAGWHLRPRLPVYPHYDDWLPDALQARVAYWRSHLAQLAPLSTGVATGSTANGTRTT